MQAKSIKGKTPEEIQSALLQAIADGFKPILAIVFLSVSQDRKSITALFDKAAIRVFGVTSNGEFTDETPEKRSTVVLLLDLKPAYFRFYNAAYPNNNFKEITYNIAGEAKKISAILHFL